MKNSRDEAVESFDQVLAMVRIMRSSLESGLQDPEVTFNSTDISHVLILVEEKLLSVKQLLNHELGDADD